MTAAGEVMRRHRLLITVITLVSATAAACTAEPVLAPDASSSYERIAGADSGDYLFAISSYAWNDKGQAAGASLKWIADDAKSVDPQTASRAGKAAQNLSEFLADRQDDLRHLSTGWFGLQRGTVGELNPGLVRGFAVALAPYQGAFVGDANGLSGFAPGADNADLDRARGVFTVIDTDPTAGDQFREAADDRTKNYLREYAQGAVGGSAPNNAALLRAGTLAGIVAGGQQASDDQAVGAQSAQYWVNWLNYELARASGARPSDGYFPTEFFASDGALTSPDDVTPSQLYAFSGVLQNFAHRNGQSDAGRDLRDAFDRAAAE